MCSVSPHLSDRLCAFDAHKTTQKQLKILTGDLCPSCRPYPNISSLGPSTEELRAFEEGWLITQLLSGYLYFQQYMGPPHINYRSVSPFLVLQKKS